MNNADIRELAASISFRQLRLFESVGRLASVRRGSEECNLSQPAVTQAIGKLEQQLSELLFERRASGSYLTEAGKVFHIRIQRLFALMEEALIDLGITGGANSAAAVSNRISRSQVRSLIAIIEHGSFPKAAEAVGLTQASLQRAARDLEGNLRKAIYHRTAAGVMVTPDGVDFGRKLKLATQEVEWGIRELRATRGTQLSQIIIGALPFGGSMLLATVLDEFVKNHPAADVKIVTEGATEMLKRLRSGDVDMVIGIMQDTTADDLSNESLSRTPYQIVGKRDHPLADKSNLTLADLALFDWVVGTEGSSRRSCYDELFADVKKPKAPIATSSLPIIRHLLTSSDKLTMMTNYELVYESSALVSIPFEEIKPSPSIGVTTRAGWLLTQLHKDFIDMLRQRVAIGK